MNPEESRRDRADAQAREFTKDKDGAVLAEVEVDGEKVEDIE